MAQRAPQTDSFAEFEHKYEKLEAKPIGEGTYGQVFKAKCRATGRHLALKRIKLEDEEEGVPSTAIREIAFLKSLHEHENIVDLVDVYCQERKLFLVFEFLDHDLKRYMRAHNPLSPRVIRSFTRQMIAGTEFCHSRRVLHRDLKPHNLLIDATQTLKIADFGLARAFALPLPEYTHEVVTIWYRCPEILMGQKEYGCPIDMWSCGCIFAEMAMTTALFPGDCEIDTLFRIFRRNGTPTEEDWPGISQLPCWKPTFPKWKAKSWDTQTGVSAALGQKGIDLLIQLLRYDPTTRLSARRAMTHAYLSDSV
mmetsp:Transcript_26955/g.59673  ORF Transcript_26955/g.59673 Transcript_26955/m.59673 type:complete len:309 (+) Transcript_26955:45-971(+)